MDHTTLRRAIQSLARLDAAGLLAEYQLDVAEATRGPRNDLDRHPEWRHSVERSASLVSSLLDVPLSDAHEAAREALLPSTRRGIALAILDEYEQRLDEEALREQATHKLRRTGA